MMGEFFFEWGLKDELNAYLVECVENEDDNGSVS